MIKAEMESIGLSEVSKDSFTLDTWTFTKAQLSYLNEKNESVLVEMGGYQTQFNSQGPKSFTLIDGGEGTEADLKDLDVRNKFVLVNINQREKWWVNYPAYEAYLKGAAGIITVQDGGYSEISDDALNAQDICGSEDAVAFSMSRNDAKAIRKIMATQNNQMEISLDAQSEVKRDGTSYNIVGKIIGQDKDSMVLVSAHYDSYFAGFQDDNAAVGLMMGIAKAMVDSGYKPEKTLVFLANAAEEWGVANTRYDWSTGAYNQIFKNHPEWVGKVVANINFELPAMNEGDTNQIRSSYELNSFINSYIGKIPAVEGVFKNGVEIINPTQTWSDDFSFSIAGIPASVTALRGDFSKTHYHSQFDNVDTYSREAFLYNHNMYGLLLLEYDRVAVSPLDFSTRLEALRKTLDQETLSEIKIDEKTNAYDGISRLIDQVEEKAQTAWKHVSKLNQSYREALDANKTKEAKEIYEAAKKTNTEVLSAFKYVEDNLVRLTWEDVSIFPQEHSQTNIAALKNSISSLEQGKATEALDNYLSLVDNNWYAYDWSKDTYNYFTDYVLNQPAERLMWGAGRVQGHVDLFDVIKSLQAKGNGQNYSSEIETLQQGLDLEKINLEKQATLVLETLKGLQERLNAIEN